MLHPGREMNRAHRRRRKISEPESNSEPGSRKGLGRIVVMVCLCAAVAGIVATLWIASKKRRGFDGYPALPRGAVTFNRDIAPIIFQHCSTCHRPGQPGP